MRKLIPSATRHVRRAKAAHAVTRVLMAVAVYTAVSLAGPPAAAHHSITFIDCPDSDPAATSQPSPSPTPEASSAPQPTPTPSPSASKCTPAPGSVLREQFTLRFHVRADSVRPIEQVDVFILSEESSIPSPNNGGPVATFFYREEDAESERTLDVPWDTRTLTPFNGSYTVRATARTYRHTPDEEQVVTAERQHLRVDNTPMMPHIPRLTEQSSNGLVLEWEAGREPDIISYTLYRAATAADGIPPSEAEFQPIRTTTNSIAVDKPGPGTYVYAIRNVRRSVVTPEEGIGSVLSQPSAPVRIEHEASSPPEGGQRPPPNANRFAPFSPRPNTDDGGFSRYLPFRDSDSPLLAKPVEEAPQEPSDLRRGLMPVAVGMFLFSACLAVLRMPY